MKRALSFILALTLAFALLPTFAMAVDMEPTELQSFTINFSGAATDGLTDYTGDYAGQRWYVKRGDTLMGSNWQVLTTKGDSNIYNLDDKTIISNATNRNKIVQYYLYNNENYLPIWVPADTDISENNTLAIKIIVPASGTYTLSADVWGSGSGGYAEIFVDEKSFGEESLNSADINTTKQTISFDNSVSLTAGEKILKIKNGNYQGKTQFSNGFFSFTFTSTEKKVNSSVSFVQTTNVDGHNDITVKTVMRGDPVTLTAHAEDIPGYEFVGWKRGSNDDDSAWVDISGDTYNVWTNTFLTAIYKPTGETAAAKTVDFWNQNGAYLGTADETSFATDVKRVPSLTGFGAFQGWFTDGKVKLDENTVLSAGTTNAVAQYDDRVVSGVTLNGEDVTEADTYNEPISLTESGVTYWMRGGKTIAYGDTYDFSVWAGAEITSHTNTVDDKTPVAILEYNEDYNAYMFEYDAGDYTIVEAGIIFGDADATVDSCTKKYTSQRKVSHNQFTVPAEAGTAKGYIIWKNASGAYQIDYFTE